MATKKYYVVWQGKKTGIFNNWAECKAQIEGYPGARYKSFDSLKAAEKAFAAGPTTTSRKQPQTRLRPQSDMVPRVAGALAVDAACSGNPGQMEYRAVWVDTGVQWFLKGPWPEATNNIGEFLAIVHALAQFEKLHMRNQTIYSDSQTAISWVKNRKAKTQLERNDRTKEILELIERAEHWLSTNTHTHRILKWPTELWGEIPADFGRK